MRKLLLLLGLAMFVSLPGCTRRYYRKSADREVDSILAEKDRYPAWKIEQYHVDPDPLARFANVFTIDRPPMPPDDPAAEALSPNPQKPGKKGQWLFEGDGYLQLIEQWDRENRETAPAPTGKKPPEPSSSGVYRDPLASRNPAPPYRITLEQAVELGLINSREFQDRREDLYLSALPVTVERFAFAPQFFAFGEATRERLGKQFPDGPANRWALDSNVGLSKLFPTGALLLFRFANRTVFEFLNRARPHTVSESTLTLDAIQPFLRGGGCAVTLEPLTQTERSLLYEIRDYARFRKQFYVAIAAGADIGGISVGTSRFRTRATPFGLGDFVPGAELRPGRGFLLNLPASGLAGASGYLPVVLNASLLENEKQNVAALEDILKRFEALKEGGDLAQLQVDRVEQQLLQGRSSAFQRDQTLRDTFDRFKLQLGVKLDLPLELDDAPVASQRKMLRLYEQLLADFDEVRGTAEKLYSLEQPGELRARLRELATTSKLVAGTKFRTDFPRRWDRWAARSASELRRELSRLRARLRQLREERDRLESPGKPVPPELLARIAEAQLELTVGSFEQSLRIHEALPLGRLAGAVGVAAGSVGSAVVSVLPGLLPTGEPVRGVPVASFRELFNDFEQLLLEARNERVEQARANWPTLPRLCAEGVDLMTADLNQAEDTVARVAVDYRFDLMNAHAQLVDAWRQVAVAANSLLGAFNVEYHLTSLTPQDQAMSFAFAGSRSRHQLVLNGELPLVRILERNNYRASLIGFQRQRRTLMASEDNIVASVRSQLRQLRVLAENYKIAQRAVELAYLQVENALDTFRAPPIPSNQPLGTGNVAGNDAALTQQLLEAQNNLIRAQNNLVTLWVQYLTTRMQLYRDLELMPLDARGVWTDDVERCHCPDGIPHGPELPTAPEPRLVPAGPTAADSGRGGPGDVRRGSSYCPARAAQ